MEMGRSLGIPLATWAVMVMQPRRLDDSDGVPSDLHLAASPSIADLCSSPVQKQIDHIEVLAEHEHT